MTKARLIVRMLTGKTPTFKVTDSWGGSDGLTRRHTWPEGKQQEYRLPAEGESLVFCTRQLDVILPSGRTVSQRAHGELVLKLKQEFPTNLAGTWGNGQFTITDMPGFDNLGPAGPLDQAVGKNEGCATMDLSQLRRLKGTPLELSTEIIPRDIASGTLALRITLPKEIRGGTEQPPIPLPYRYAGGVLSVQMSQEGARVVMQARFSRLDGSWKLSGDFQIYASMEGQEILAMKGKWSGIRTDPGRTGQ
jgi:hypothetical protein